MSGPPAGPEESPGEADPEVVDFVAIGFILLLLVLAILLMLAMARR